MYMHILIHVYSVIHVHAYTNTCIYSGIYTYTNKSSNTCYKVRVDRDN